MLLQPGSTICPHCQKPLFLTDDIISIKQFVGTEEIEGFTPGLYHYVCFLHTAFREAYVEIKRFYEHEKFVGLDDEYMKTLQISREFALVMKRAVREFSLKFFDEDREISFFELSALYDFTEFVLNPSLYQKETQFNDVGVSRLDKDWRIYQRHSSDAFFLFTELDYRKIATYLGIEGDTPVGRTINLFEACNELRVAPVNKPLPIEKAIGKFKLVEPLLDSPTVQLVISIELFKNIYISNEKLSLLGEFLNSVESILAKDFVDFEY